MFSRITASAMEMELQQSLVQLVPSPVKVQGLKPRLFLHTLCCPRLTSCNQEKGAPFCIFSVTPRLSFCQLGTHRRLFSVIPASLPSSSTLVIDRKALFVLAEVLIQHVICSFGLGFFQVTKHTQLFFSQFSFKQICYKLIKGYNYL